MMNDKLTAAQYWLEAEKRNPNPTFYFQVGKILKNKSVIFNRVMSNGLMCNSSLINGVESIHAEEKL